MGMGTGMDGYMDGYTGMGMRRVAIILMLGRVY
jgi:hypothetical protein